MLQLDQLNEILGNVSVPVGTYTAATITVSGNPGDVLLTVSADPETGFAAAAGTTIPSSQIQIMNTKGSAGSSDRPGEVESGDAAGGYVDAEQRIGLGIRSFASGFYRGACASVGRRNDDVGGEF